ncbi:MAG: LysR family transcriptional regulator [OCS116 cluster bacterium]|uniref:HTH lysR-type domain-containing protein n=1 Tax=OCS116 cluster bacterium TaxID=2030921 RepID=A0A2A4Z1E1_9PROT|nr:LysR family transcriptional regulator [OCS116 cluster bacterium]
MPNKNTDILRIGQFRLFKEIYEQASLQGAASSLNITQSSASKQLKLMREQFGDDLFVRTSADMKPTEKATKMIGNVQNILNEIDGLSENDAFEPAFLTTHFTVSVADELQCFLIPKLMERLAEEAPNVRLSLCLHDKDYDAKQLEDGHIKLVLAVNCTAPEHLTQSRIYSDDFVCLMRKDHHLNHQKLELQNYVDADHLSVVSLMELSFYIEKSLTSHGFKRRIKLIIPTFIQAENILLYSDHILTCPRRMAKQLASHGGLAIVELPMQVQSFSYFQFWHQRYNKDPARMWLKGMVDDILGAY